MALELIELAPTRTATRFGRPWYSWSPTPDSVAFRRALDRLGLTAAEASRRLGVTTGELAAMRAGGRAFDLGEATRLINVGGRGRNPIRVS